MSHFLSRKNIGIISVMILVCVLFFSCDKGGGSFSVLSETSQYQQSLSYSPRKIDVLFVVDNSGSMLSSQNNLAEHFSSFIDKFIAKDFDFRIAVTTTDTYLSDQFTGQINCTQCNLEYAKFKSGTNPKVFVIDRSDFDFSSANDIQRMKDIFSANIKVGINGSADERAFSSFKSTLSSSLNVNFHRSDAFLALVIVSDEDDFSQSAFKKNESYTNPSLNSVQSYSDFLATFTGGSARNDFSVSIISVIDQQCRDQLLDASKNQKIGKRYIDLAQLTGGTVNSLCSSFDTSLDNISSQILVQAKPIYKLNKKPIVSSIAVTIEGRFIPNNPQEGWSYDSNSNCIIINGSQYKPDSGANIAINFDPYLG